MISRTISILFVGLVVFSLFITACAGQAPESSPEKVEAEVETATASGPTRTPPPPEPTKERIELPSYQAQLKITTSSDWTVIRLTEGTWHSYKLISKSDTAQVEELDGNTIQLKQPISQANANQKVELIAEVFFTDNRANDTLTFEIDRGYIGSTQLEISKIAGDSPEVIATFNWEDIKPVGPNIETFMMQLDAPPGLTPNEYIVIAQLNFWYYGPGPYGGFENMDGSRSTPLIPKLGKSYSAADPDVVYQQIEWAAEYGVDAFSIEWTTPRGVGCCGSMEDTLDDVFLKSPNISKVRWVIFYDFILRLMQTEELEWQNFPVNFDQPAVYKTFVDDFVHFAKKYFDHPQYLTIDGRPVIYVWASFSYEGNMAGAIQEARERVAELGYDVFIVGDEVCLNCFNSQHTSQFDGSSTFTFLIPGVDNTTLQSVGDAVKTTDYTFGWWKDRLDGLKVAGREDLVNFQPGWAPQYDESWIRDIDNPIRVQAESKNQVQQMAEVARKHAEPVGEENLKLIWLNTWNNWAETTTVEPTADEGPKYPGGNYGFDFLEVIREVFGPETYYTSQLP